MVNWSKFYGRFAAFMLALAVFVVAFQTLTDWWFNPFKMLVEIVLFLIVSSFVALMLWHARRQL